MPDSINIVCPHCDATNRVPRHRPVVEAKCGRCKQMLFDGAPVELNDQNFTKHLRNNDVPVLVDFWASWCGPCKMMAPVFEQAAKELQPEIRLAKVNTESARQLAAQVNIRSIPTMVLFKKGAEVARVAGAMDLSNLRAWVASQGVL